MKEKSKKIMAGLGIGLALASGGMLTGCSMSDEQQAALNSVIDKTDQIVELLDKQSKTLSQAEALRLYEFARTRLLVNKDNVWDNLKMIINQDSNEVDHYDTVFGELAFYKFADGRRVAYVKTGTPTNPGQIGGWFEEVVSSDGYQTITQKETYSHYASTNTTSGISEFDITEEDIVDCKILDNGNYYVTASLMIEETYGGKTTSYPFLMEVELTADGYLVEYLATAKIPNGGDSLADSVDQYILTTSIKYQYGVLTDAEVQANIDAYKVQEGL